jgi:cob(I)alamin adenosyltransferase
MIQKGYVHLYTGNGKGKTTAALGLAFRASGAGLKSVFIQFMKGQHYSELDAAARMSLIEIEQYGSPEFYNPATSSFLEHRGLSKRGLLRAGEILSSGDFDIIILDEIIGALNFNLVTYDEILELITMKPETQELVLTGRDAPSDLFQHCDLVTEMIEIKHYYADGVAARKGIEM